MSDAVVTLQPWDGTPRAFSIWENHYPNPDPAVVSDTLSSGSWNVSGGEIFVQWGGWFNASHHHEGGQLFRINLDECVPGQPVEFGYVPFPGKVNSVVVECAQPATPPPPTSTSTTAPAPTTSTVPVTVPDQDRSTTTAPLGTPQGSLDLLSATPAPTAPHVYSCAELGRVVYSGELEYSLNLDSDQDGIGCEEYIVGVASNNGNLPNTGSNTPVTVTAGLGVILLGCAILARAKKFLV